MIPNTLRPGNKIIIPNGSRGFLNDPQLSGSEDVKTREFLLANDCSVDVKIVGQTKYLKRERHEVWKVQMFGYRKSWNVCIHTNMDVISGFFSGCLMASYIKSGYRRVTHVYTETDGKTAKDGFKKYIYHPSIEEAKVSRCFKPEFNTKISFNQGKFDLPCCLGIITREDKCYSVSLLYNTSEKVYHIVHVQEVQRAQDWAYVKL